MQKKPHEVMTVRLILVELGVAGKTPFDLDSLHLQFIVKLYNIKLPPSIRFSKGNPTVCLQPLTHSHLVMTRL